MVEQPVIYLPSDVCFFLNFVLHKNQFKSLILLLISMEVLSLIIKIVHLWKQ